MAVIGIYKYIYKYIFIYISRLINISIYIYIYKYMYIYLYIFIDDLRGWCGWDVLLHLHAAPDVPLVGSHVVL